jgi:hypothetical protein
MMAVSGKTDSKVNDLNENSPVYMVIGEVHLPPVTVAACCYR